MRGSAGSEDVESRMTVGYEVSPPALAAGQPAGTEFRNDAFVLESRGWSSLSTECAPKLAALACLANLAPPDPVVSRWSVFLRLLTASVIALTKPPMNSMIPTKVARPAGKRCCRAG